MKYYSKIKGLSDSRRLPRIDKIRLGAKFEAAGSGKEYPVELPFFLLPESVAIVHGGKIKNIKKRAKELGITRANVLDFIGKNAHRLAEELPVMIPVEETEFSFPQAYIMYGGSIGMKCTGNGEEASERIGKTKEFKTRQCPCDQLKNDQNPRGACTIKARLQVMLPDVSMGGIFQIDIGSINSIIDINSGIDYVRSLISRVSMVPLKLRRIPTETHHDGKKQIHYTCQLTIEGNINAIAQLKEDTKILSHKEVLALDAPDYTDPELDAVDAVYEMPEEIKKMVDELRELAKSKKISAADAKDIALAVENNDEIAIEEIYRDIQAKKLKGSSQEDVTAKLTKEEPPPPEEPETLQSEQGQPQSDSRF
jgi:hypothetical protein